MAEWRETQALLMETAEIENVYFQPPSGYKMRYPAIVFAPKTPNRCLRMTLLIFGNRVTRLL